MSHKIAGGNELLNPEYLLRDVLHLNFQSKVADLGCGSMAFFTLQAAKLVGEKGIVYAVDILKEVLSSAESRAKQEGLYNIRTVWSDVEIVGAAKITSESLDYALLVNTLFQTRKHQEVIAEAYRLLRPGGRLMVIDWITAGSPIGPTQELRVDPAEAKRLAGEAGFKVEKEFKAGANHYGIIFIK